MSQSSMRGGRSDRAQSPGNTGPRGSDDSRNLGACRAITAWRSTLVIASLICSLATTPAAGAAEDRPTAREKAKPLLAAGAELYRKGDFAGAFARFKAAYDIFPTPKINYNFGLVYEAQGKPAQAVAQYERFLRGAEDAPPESIADARERLKRLSTVVGFVALSADSADAEAFLDGVPVGKIANLGTVPVEVGNHHVLARSRQLGSQSRNFAVQAGQVATLQIQLRPDGQPAPNTATSPPSAASDASAEQLIVKGVELRKQRKNLEAYDLFRQAYEMSPRARPSAQLGLIEYQLGKWVDAEAHLEQALQSKDDPFIRSNRATVDEALSVVRSHIGFVTVTGTPPGAEVSVNGKKAGPVPARLIKASTGYAEVLVTAPGYAPARRTLTLEPQLTQELFIALDPQTGPPPLAGGGGAPGLGVTTGGDPGNEPPPGPSLGPMRISGIIVALGGLAAAGYGAFQTYKVSSLSAQTAKEDSKGVERGRDAERRQWLGYGLGAAGLAAGGLLVWLGGHPGDSARPAVSLLAHPRGDGGLISLRVVR